MYCEQNNLMVDLASFSFTFRAGEESGQKVKQATPRAVASPRTPKTAAGKGLKAGPGKKRKMGDRSEGKGHGPVHKKMKTGVKVEGKSKVNKSQKMEVKKKTKKNKKELQPIMTKAVKKLVLSTPDLSGKLRVKFSFKKQQQQQQQPSKVAARTRKGPSSKKSAR